MLYLNKRTSSKDWMRYLGEHNFKHSLQNICMCKINVKPYLHFFHHCHLFFQKKRILLSIIESIDNELLDYGDFHLTKILLFGDVSLDVNINSSTINPTINVLISKQLLFLLDFVVFPFSDYTDRASNSFVFLSLFLSYTRCS